MSIEITHTAAEGTLVHGTARGDGTHAILKACGFRWFGTLGLWGLAGSRDRQPNRHKIDRVTQALRDAGHTVTVDIDDTHRPTAEAEADRAQRQAGRAQALAAKAERRATAADTAWDAEQSAVEALPPGGEPIKIGHHSERRHRNAIARAHGATRRAIDATAAAQTAEQRAHAAAATTERRHNPVTVKNRIHKMQAEQRADQRILDGHRRVVARSAAHEYVDEFAPATGPYREQVIARMAQRADEIAYWQGVYAQQRPPVSPAATAETPSPKATSSSIAAAGTASCESTSKPCPCKCTPAPHGQTPSATTRSPDTSPARPTTRRRHPTGNRTTGPGQPPHHRSWSGPFFPPGAMAAARPAQPPNRPPGSGRNP